MDTNSKKAKRTFWAIAAFYFLIAFEFFYMASPFAAYFYSVYKPALEFLDNYPAVAWTTGFFLPHLVVDTKSALIDAIPLIGGLLATIGLATFLVCAGQVYYSKLLKKSVVTGGLYKWIRHPQYTAFAICSFGLLLIWPRYLVLIMYATLLFAYYFLARAEENECERKFGKPYLDYKKRTGMFFPTRQKDETKSLLKSIPKHLKPIAYIGLYFIILTSSIFLANRLKEASLSNLYKLEKNNSTYLSIIEKKDTELEQLITTASKNNKVDSLLHANPNQKLINYVLPSEMYISEIPMQAPETPYNHVWGHDYEGRNFKLVYTKANLGKNEKIQAGLKNTLSVTPLFEVWVDTQTNEVLKVIELSGTLRYGNISEPVF